MGEHYPLLDLDNRDDDGSTVAMPTNSAQSLSRHQADVLLAEFPVLAGLTERQAAAWPGAVAEAQRYVPCSTIPVDIDHYEWRVTWGDETRPGRGRMIDATWCDGEYYVQIRMDVYGYPDVSVAETRWLHSSSYEECDCTWCEREREEKAP